MAQHTDVTTPRERRRQRVRRELTMAALRLFAEKGYAATTVEEIAAAVDYSASTFHRHFARKEDVAFHEVPRMAAELTELMAGPVEGDPWSVVKEALIRFAAEWEEEPGLGPASARVFLTVPELRSRWLEITEETGEVIARFLEEGYGCKEPDLLCTMAARSVMLAARSAVEVQLATGGRVSDHLEHALRLVEQGVGGELKALNRRRGARGATARR